LTKNLKYPCVHQNVGTSPTCIFNVGTTKIPATIQVTLDVEIDPDDGHDCILVLPRFKNGMYDKHNAEITVRSKNELGIPLEESVRYFGNSATPVALTNKPTENTTGTTI
jgi:hypothetical protein